MKSALTCTTPCEMFYKVALLFNLNTKIHKKFQISEKYDQFNYHFKMICFIVRTSAGITQYRIITIMKENYFAKLELRSL
jgi:hypothetical protein